MHCVSWLTRVAVDHITADVLAKDSTSVKPCLSMAKQVSYAGFQVGLHPLSRPMSQSRGFRLLAVEAAVLKSLLTSAAAVGDLAGGCWHFKSSAQPSAKDLNGAWLHLAYRAASGQAGSSGCGGMADANGALAGKCAII